MKPIEYGTSELKEISIALDKIHFNSYWKNIIGIYFLKKDYYNKCSFCKKRKEIFLVERNKFLLEDKYSTYYLICHSCATVRGI